MIDTRLLLQEYSTLRTLVLTLYEEPKVPGSLAYVIWRERTHEAYDALCELTARTKRWPNDIVREIKALCEEPGLLVKADREFPKHDPPLVING